MADEKTPVADGGASQDQEPREVAPSVDQSSDADTGASQKRGSRKDDLSNHPQFREMQSEYQRRLREQQAENERIRKEAAEARQLAEQAYLRDMTDSERAQYEEQRRLRSVAEERELLRRQQQEVARMRDIFELHRKSGAPIEELEKAQDYDEAVAIALDWKEKSILERVESEQRQRQQKAAANSVDLGGGSARTELDDWERQYKEAKARGDVKGLMDLAFKKPRG